MRVLIADDTEDIRMLLRLTLQKDGRFEVVGEARDGQEAVEMAETTRPDAIVLDLAMPVMDGLQALPHIRRILPRSRIVVLSGFNASQMADEALSLGADAYLEKGSAFGRLVAMLVEGVESPGTLITSVVRDTRGPAVDRSALVHDALTAVTGASNLADAFNGFCGVAAQGMSYDRASFWIVREDETVECAAVHDEDAGRLAKGTTMSLVGRVRRLLDGEPIIEPDTARDTENGTFSVLNAHGIRSAMGLPLVVGAETKAFVCFSSNRPYGFSHEDVPFVTNLAREAASTLHLLYLLDNEREARSRLKEVDQLKNDLVGIVAHDLRSPMTVIGGYAQHMRDSWTTLDEPKKLQFLDAISRNVDDVAKLVEDMLEVASLESGRLHCDNELFDLGEVIRATVAELAVANPGRICAMTVPSDLPRAIGDARRQRQILANLISNALKFSDPGEPVEIVVALKNSAAAVSVRDRGEGISPAHLPMIFEKFYRVKDTGKPKVAGNGLGLYICRLLVDAQGGEIWAESAPGTGSTFTYTVRVTDARASTAA
jgi:signal transduction histidine kinase/ActR/RegA family two-component response regulator